MSNKIIKRCPICKKRTEHTESGFRNHNYRLVCTTCKSWNYVEED